MRWSGVRAWSLDKGLGGQARPLSLLAILLTQIVWNPNLGISRGGCGVTEKGAPDLGR